MKRFIEVTLALKNMAGLCFTGTILIYMVVGWFFGLRAVTFSLLWQFLAIAIICGVLQFVFFSGNVVKTMRYSLRVLCFGAPLYLCVSVLAMVFRWFPMRPMSWLVFTGIFLAILVVLAVVFELYFKLVGRQYNQILQDYKGSDL